MANDQTPPPLSDARRALLQRYLRGVAASPAATPVTIPRRSGPGPAPLSPSQRQIWLHSQLAGDVPIYNEPITIQRDGPLNRDALERAFTEVVRRHEAWRTTFAWQGDRGVQIVQPAPAHIAIPFVDLRTHPNAEAEAIRLATDDVLQPFDLARGPMYRLRLVRLTNDEHRLFLALHHIIFDGVSLYRVLLPELLACYEALAKNEPPSLAPLPIQYSDYATWQQAPAQQPTPAQIAYWQNALDNLPLLELPKDHPRPPAQTYAGAMELLDIPPATADALKALSQEQGATPFMTMLAAFAVLLHSYSGQEDIVIGGITSGRRHTETLGLLGCFLNTIPIRCTFAKEQPFTDLLARVRESTVSALSHDDVPFELLVQKFARHRHSSRAPLFQVLIVMEPPLESLPAGWSFRHMDVETGTAKFDLQLGLDDRAEGSTGRFIYNTDLFDAATIVRLKTRWLALLDQIAAAPTTSVNELARASHSPAAILPNEELSYPRDASIHALFEAQVRRAPDATALVVGETELSYEELNLRANRLARRLQALGVQRDVPVGVCLERSIEMIVALLAILKAGGAYVPLDPAYPAERLALLIADIEPPVILTTTPFRDACHPEPRKFSKDLAKEPTILCLDEPETNTDSESNLPHKTSAEDLAYIIFTSGSTGIPKGVAIPHRGVVRLVKGADYATFTPDETFLQLAPLSFDASTFEIWGALLNGGRLVIMPPAPPTLGEIGTTIRRHGVTTLWLTSALFNAMIDERLADLRPLRQLLAGGDILSVIHVRTALRGLKNTRLINGYGPTESTTFACCYNIPPELENDAPLPIGKPIEHTTAQIFDENLKPVALGSAGELHLGGDGLARGYWRRPELTGEKFIVVNGERLYKTGDLARAREDGTLEFLGRIDGQIKLRGFRIEPGEIEAALNRQPSVRDSAVLLREDTPGDKRLVAYVVRQSEWTDTDQSSVMAALQETLPDYMIPSAIVPLETFPRTANGKLDRRALPAPAAGKDFVAPQTSLEEKLSALWADILGLERVGVSDNFFDLGGHSLVALRLVNQLREQLGVHLSLVILFEAPTVRALAQLLQRTHAAAIALWLGITRNPSLDQASAPPLVPFVRPLPPVTAVNRDSRRAPRPAEMDAQP
ncbi:MAG: non-ribosomal peptide synthetase [Chthoniobacterales bacterium]